MTFSVLGIDTQTKQRVDIPQSSRRRGLYLIGATGTGKSTLLENLIVQDIRQGIGVCLLDPHGDLIEAVLSKLPDVEHEEQVILLDISDEDYPFGLNLFTCEKPDSAEKVQEVVDLVMHIFDKLFDISRSTPQMAYYLRNCTHTLIANPGYTMADIPLLLTDSRCRKKLVANVVDSQVRLFWAQYERMRPSEQDEKSMPIINKLNEFLQPLPVNIVGQSVSTINIREVMDDRKILLVKLNPRLEAVTSLIGSVLVALMLHAAYSRADIKKKQRKQFHIYADEFQRFATEDFATLLTEARKFGIGTTVAHQTRDQLDRQNRSATMNVANFIVFRVSGNDSDELARQFDATPPPAELRREQKLQPVRDVVSHLDHVGHSDNDVNNFVKDLMLPIYNGVDYLGRDNSGRLTIDFHRTTTRQLLDMLNTLFYEVMADQNPRKVVPTKLFYYLAKIASPGFPDIFQILSKNLVVIEPNTMFRPYLPYERWLNNELKQLLDSFWLDPAVNNLKADSLRESQDYQKIMGLLFNEYINERVPQYIRKQYFEDKITYEEYKKERDKIDDKPFLDQYMKFHAFIALILITMDRLAKEPITSGSGIYEMVPGIQRTYQDMQNEIASNLVTLPQRTARVKIAAEDGIVEHTVQITQPERGIGLVALQERIERIRTQNRKSGYCQPRKDVEKEIRKRQEDYEPPEEPPSSPRRKKIN